MTSDMNPMKKNQKKVVGKKLVYGKGVYDLESYRPAFGKVLELYSLSAGLKFRRGGTVNKQNYIVKIKPMPHGVYYYFIDKPDANQIGFELDVNISLAPAFEKMIRELREKRFENLPVPELAPLQKTKDGTWLRLQFYYPEVTHSSVIVDGLSKMIEQTYKEILRVEERG